MSEVWIDKYRPKSFDEVLGQSAVVKRIRSYVEAGTIPNLLFHGREGVGKSTLVYLIAKGIYGGGFEDNLTEIDASDFFNRGKAYLEADPRFEHFYEKNKPVIETFKEVINEYASLMPIDADFKIIFFRNADALTLDAQQALRRMIERYNRTCRFIFTTKRPSKIIPPLRSRALNLYLGKIEDELIEEHLKKIMEKEGLTFDEKTLQTIISRASGSLGQAIYALQYYSLAGKLPEIRDDKIDELLSLSLSGDFVEVAKMIEALTADSGFTGYEVIDMIHDRITSGDYPLSKQLEEVILIMADFDMRIIEGANERIQLEALLSKISEV